MNSFTSKRISTPQEKHKEIRSSLFRRVIKYIPKNKKEYQQKKIPFYFLVVATLTAAIIIFKVTYTSYLYLTHFEIKDLIGIFSAELQTDSKNRTNILVLGTGGAEHDGGNLTDTIMIASLNKAKHTVSIVSIPRDLWLDFPGYGSSRVNKIYDTLKDKYGSEQALDILKEGIQNISNVSIPYYVKIDFEGFKQVIDTLGGIEITVEKSIYDTSYPTEDKAYEIFTLEAGTQIMDGETALKYARSRHSTSDFDRALRQQAIINAIKEKGKETNIISSPLLLKRLYEDFSDHIETNLKTTELISVARFAENFDNENLTSAVLRDVDIIDVGSFLYTPERELYGGAFVLVPLGETYEKIQRFISIVFDYPEFFKENAGIQILNGSTNFGQASRLNQKLLPYGFNIQNLANADRKNYTETHYYINNPENTRVTEEVLKLFLPKAIKVKVDPPESFDTSYDITIVMGKESDTSNL